MFTTYTIDDESIKFQWDDEKNAANIKKHGVSFFEAMTVFFDVNAIVSADSNHSEMEERFNIIGYSANEHLLIVCQP